jgi:hypothetical protein
LVSNAVDGPDAAAHWTAAAILGEHTEEILTSGYDQQALSSYERSVV